MKDNDKKENEMTGEEFDPDMIEKSKGSKTSKSAKHEDQSPEASPRNSTSTPTESNQASPNNGTSPPPDSPSLHIIDTPTEALSVEAQELENLKEWNQRKNRGSKRPNSDTDQTANKKNKTTLPGADALNQKIRDKKQQDQAMRQKKQDIQYGRTQSEKNEIEKLVDMRCKAKDINTPEERATQRKIVLKNEFKKQVQRGASKTQSPAMYQFEWSNDDTHCTVKDSYAPDAKVLFEADVNADSITYYPKGEYGAQAALNSILATESKTISVTGGTDEQRWDIILMASTDPEFKGTITLDDSCFDGFTDPTIKQKVADLKSGNISEIDLKKYSSSEPTQPGPQP